MSDLQKCKQQLSDLQQRIEKIENQDLAASGQQAASTQQLGSTGSVQLTSGQRPTAAVEHQRVFDYRPRNIPGPWPVHRPQSRKDNRKGHYPASKRAKQPTWSRSFVCLANTCDDRMPNSTYYKALRKASLGEKYITFLQSDNSSKVDFNLKLAYPKLEMAGGYTLLCSHSSSRILEVIEGPYSVKRLKEETGQCKIFVRPLQKDLDLTPDGSQEEKKEVILYLLYLLHVY